MTPEQAAAGRVHEAVAQANLCMPPLSTIIVATDDAAAILAALDAAQAALVHITHCNFGEHAGSCKYGDENCPALSDGLSWIGKGLDAGQAVAKWETTLSAVMPADFKDWHQNSRAEWPEIAAWAIRNLREREAEAWKHVERVIIAANGKDIPPPDDPPIPDPREETRQALIAWAVAYGKKVACKVAAAQAPQSEAGWLHRLDMEKTAAWQQGYAQGQHRAAQAPREAPRLTDLQVADCVTGIIRPYPMDLVTVDADQLLAFSRAIESRVRELCGVAP